MPEKNKKFPTDVRTVTYITGTANSFICPVYAEFNENDTCQKTARPLLLLRTFCDSAKNLTRKSRCFCRTSRGNNRSEHQNNLRLGSRSNEAGRGVLSASRNRLRSFIAKDYLARKINFYIFVNSLLTCYLLICRISPVISRIDIDGNMDGGLSAAAGDALYGWSGLAEMDALSNQGRFWSGYFFLFRPWFQKGASIFVLREENP